VLLRELLDTDRNRVGVAVRGQVGGGHEHLAVRTAVQPERPAEAGGGRTEVVAGRLDDEKGRLAWPGSFSWARNFSMTPCMEAVANAEAFSVTGFGLVQPSRGIPDWLRRNLRRT
jgi:hypothetical protein